jgi:hypothetical protein
MTRKLKVLTLALTAVLAMSALAAASAQAILKSNKEHTIIHGVQEGSVVFSAGAGFGGISCETATLSGTSASLEAESMVATPTMANCKDSFGRVVHIHTNSLTYTFTEDGTVHMAGTISHTITSGGSVVCTTNLKAQSNAGAAYENLGGTSGIRSKIENTGIVSTTSGGFLNCGLANGEHKEGTAKGNFLTTGKDTSGNAAEISIQ